RFQAAAEESPEKYAAAGRIQLRQECVLRAHDADLRRSRRGWKIGAATRSRKINVASPIDSDAEAKVHAWRRASERKNGPAEIAGVHQRRRARSCGVDARNDGLLIWGITDCVQRANQRVVGGIRESSDISVACWAKRD